mmetsp:Transcript_93668/g.269720  ORF Transcript_93668/g.269720 Transcript_93668/m.269720 type:complete len:343 (-) Transcript_93668:65-1093(-)
MVMHQRFFEAMGLLEAPAPSGSPTSRTPAGQRRPSWSPELSETDEDVFAGSQAWASSPTPRSYARRMADHCGSVLPYASSESIPSSPVSPRSSAPSMPIGVARQTTRPRRVVKTSPLEAQPSMQASPMSRAGQASSTRTYMSRISLRHQPASPTMARRTSRGSEGASPMSPISALAVATWESPSQDELRSLPTAVRKMHVAAGQILDSPHSGRRRSIVANPPDHRDEQEGTQDHLQKLYGLLKCQSFATHEQARDRFLVDRQACTKSIRAQRGRRDSELRVVSKRRLCLSDDSSADEDLLEALMQQEAQPLQPRVKATFGSQWLSSHGSGRLRLAPIVPQPA